MADRAFLDWPFLEERHRILHDRVDRWARERLPDMRLDEGEDAESAARSVRALVAELGRAGLCWTAVGATDAGYSAGAKLDGRSLCVTRDVLARHSGLADFAFAMQGLGSGAISLFGSPEQKQAWLPDIGRGARLAAFALSEAEAGSDVAAIETTATRDGDGYRIDGMKSWISNAGVADIHVVFARTGEQPGNKGLSAFVVESGTPGFTVEKIVDVTSPHPFGTLGFDGCRVPAGAMIGSPGQGFAIAMAVLDVFRPTVGAAALGFARASLDAAVDHTTTRRLSGQMLSDYQMTRASIADMALEIDAAALLVYRAAWLKDVQGVRTPKEAAMAKLFATEAAQRAVDAAVQLFGARGVVKGSLPERLYRDIRPLRIYEGATEVQKLIIASRVIEERAKARAGGGEA